MNKKTILLFLVTALLMSGTDKVRGQQLPYLNSISVTATVAFDQQTSIYTYRYLISNGSSSQGAVAAFDLVITRSFLSVNFDTTGLKFKRPWMEDSFRNIYPVLANRIIPVGFPSTPAYWSGLLGNAGIASFFGDGRNDILPGQNLDGFIMASKGLPGIRTFTARPRYDPNDFYPSVDDVSEEEAEQIAAQVDSDYVRLPFRGKTVGPIAPAAMFDAIDFLDTLISYTNQSLALGWIANQLTADKYEGHFNTARTRLQQTNIAAARAELQTVLQEVEQDKVSALTSEAYALLRFNTEYLLDQLPEQSNSIAILATHSIWLEQNSEILSGSVVVNESGDPPFLDSQVALAVGIGSSIAVGCDLKAHSIMVKQNATVAGNVYYNELSNNGAITGT
ncbi:MAG: hypothetical protein ACREBU_17540, partial [Nitrososphaera sp.]